MAAVMLIEDDLDSCVPLAVFLQRAGHTVRIAPNGREAIVAAIDSPPDVLVLDLLLPEMDGVTFLQVLHSYLRLRALPVVVLSGFSEGQLLDRVREQHPRAILTKGKAAIPEIIAAIEAAAAPAPCQPH